MNYYNIIMVINLISIIKYLISIIEAHYLPFNTSKRLSISYDRKGGSEKSRFFMVTKFLTTPKEIGK